MRRLLALLPAVALAAVVPPAAADEHVTVTKETVTITTTVGPDGTTECDVVADLYRPSTATPETPAPAILTTNGFGGSKDDQAGTGDAFGKRGYVVLSYSGLGFGGSGCNITLDDRAWDGKAAEDLVTYLAGLGYVRLDGPGDPRVGMVGGSYGGQVQYAAAAVDKRIDTIIPVITWWDLSYSLAPNNLGLGEHTATIPPGVPKWQWTELFFTLGVSQPVQHPDSTPKPPSSCPGFDPRACQANADTIARGYPGPDTIAMLRGVSVASYVDDIKIPTLIAQGQADTLFNLNEGVAAYQALKARKVPVKLMFQSWGHSGSAAPGELDLGDPDSTYQGRVFAAWFDKYLKDMDVDTGPEFEYFRPWVSYTGSADPAYAGAPRYPLHDTLPLALSGTDALVGPRTTPVEGTATFAAPPGGLPASYSETSAVQTTEPFKSRPPSDPPGQFAAFTTAPLGNDVDVVGVPTLDVTLRDVGAPYADPALQLTLYAKVYDVAPDGSQTLVHRLVSPARIGDLAAPVRIHLPGIVHRFAEGHRLRLVLASTDLAYISSRGAHVVSVVNDPARPNVLTLPVATKQAADALPRVLGERRVTQPRTGAGAQGGARIPSTGGAEWLAVLAAASAAAALGVRRAATGR
ncbi:MAG TPA: CocE/NonD family hydrolase [Frankiaceae bacterium]|nr:CocE/NonD family hydrolase [Frankiaceae bacterium]